MKKNANSTLVTTLFLTTVVGIACDAHDDSEFSRTGFVDAGDPPNLPFDHEPVGDEAEVTHLDGDNRFIPDVSIEAYDGVERPLFDEAPDGVTYIHLSDAEMKGLGDEGEGTVVGGLIVVQGALKEDEIMRLKSSLLLHGNESTTAPKEQAPYDITVAETDPQLACQGYYLQGIAYMGDKWHSKYPIQVVSGAYPQVLHLNVNKSVNSSWSANVGITVQAVNVGVGYNVDVSYGVSSSTDWTVPFNKNGKLEAFAVYRRHDWDVWYDPCVGYDYEVGWGRSYQPIGVFFKTTTW